MWICDHESLGQLAEVALALESNWQGQDLQKSQVIDSYESIICLPLPRGLHSPWSHQPNQPANYQNLLPPKFPSVFFQLPY